MYNDIGNNLFRTLQGLLNGNLGFALGLVLVVAGIITVAVRKETGAGLVMILGGALITLAPGVFNSTRILLAQIIANVGGNQTTSGFQTRPGL